VDRIAAKGEVGRFAFSIFKVSTHGVGGSRCDQKSKLLPHEIYSKISKTSIDMGHRKKDASIPPSISSRLPKNLAKKRSRCPQDSQQLKKRSRCVHGRQRCLCKDCGGQLFTQILCASLTKFPSYLGLVREGNASVQIFQMYG
jgi:hypothetical protein